jgi:hypothetical protein
VQVSIDALELRAEALVGEVVPAADPVSRTFLVKVDLPEIDELRSGLFGRLRLEVGARAALVVPQEALRRVGGLDLVRVVEDDRQSTRYVKVGREIEPGVVEILSGLKEGEHVALESAKSHD